MSDVFISYKREDKARVETLYALLLDLDVPVWFDTGIEVEARPSGKNVRKLSLLSGGERSLVALAYLFAVFRARPSP